MQKLRVWALSFLKMIISLDLNVTYEIFIINSYKALNESMEKSSIESTEVKSSYHMG